MRDNNVPTGLDHIGNVMGGFFCCFVLIFYRLVLLVLN